MCGRTPNCVAHCFRAPVCLRREGKRIEVRGGVAGTARIAVLAPDAPDLVCALKYDDVRHALLQEPNRCAEPGEACSNDRDIGLCRVGIPRGGCGWVRGWHLDGLRLDGLHLDGRDLRVDVNACAGRTICLHQNQIVGACRGRDSGRQPIGIGMLQPAQTNQASCCPAPAVRPGRRDVSRRRVFPGATGQLVDTQVGTAPHSDGPYRIEEIPTGPYDLRVRLGGLAPPQPPITVGAGAEPPRAIAREGAVVPAQKRTSSP